jgi:hypothetical protein
MAIELGPILRFESRLIAGRKSGYAVRMAFGLALLALLATYHWAFGENVQRGDSPSRVQDFPEIQSICDCSNGRSCRWSCWDKLCSTERYSSAWASCSRPGVGDPAGPCSRRSSFT